MKTHGSYPQTFRILVEERLDASWSEWLGGLEILRADDGGTLVSGELPDQSALIGLLLKIHHMGMNLVCVRRCTR